MSKIELLFYFGLILSIIGFGVLSLPILCVGGFLCGFYLRPFLKEKNWL